MKYKIPLNFPNILSLYRLIVFPFILYLIISEQETLFALFICINLFTDILDGFIARRFNMQTEIGAKLDSIADVSTYILAILGVIIFKSSDFYPHMNSFIIFISLFVSVNILSIIKFGRFPSLHLYSWKVGGYIQGLFFAILFTTGFYPTLYYIMIIWGIAAFLEHILIQLLLKKMISNAKGLYWILNCNN